jgi:Tfp pilus assembly protein PilV
MQTTRRRLTSGESITEVLVAILVAALAGTMIAVAVTLARGTTDRSANFEQHAYASTSQAETMLANGSGGAEAGTVRITFGVDSSHAAQLTSNSTSTDVTAYVTNKGAGATGEDAEGYEDLLVFVP